VKKYFFQRFFRLKISHFLTTPFENKRRRQKMRNFETEKSLKKIFFHN